jgi:hypothetical protein
VRHDGAQWQRLLRIWNDEAQQFRLGIRNRQSSTDDVWRIPAGDNAEVELVVDPWTIKPKKIEWFAPTPKYARCNLTDLSIAQVGFVANAASHPAWSEIPVEYHDSILPIRKLDNFSTNASIVAPCGCEHAPSSTGKFVKRPFWNCGDSSAAVFEPRSASNSVCRIFLAAANCHNGLIPDRKRTLVPIAQTSSYTRCAGRASALRGQTRKDCAIILILLRDQLHRAQRQFPLRICSAAQSFISGRMSLQSWKIERLSAFLMKTIWSGTNSRVRQKW